MDIKPSSSLINALGQQDNRVNDLSNPNQKRNPATDERNTQVRTRKTDPRQTIEVARPMDGANKTSTKIEIKAAQTNIENLGPKTDFHREAPMVVGEVPKFQKLGQIVDIKV